MNRARTLASLAVFLPSLVRAAPPGNLSINFPIDVTLWSPARISRFKQAMKVESDPPVAVLRIPKFHLQMPVFRGSDSATLDRGLGWIVGTARPGSTGNTAIAGHRDSFFRPLKDIAVNDEIDLVTSETVERFLVHDFRVVDPSRIEVLAPTADTELTLVTCYPFYVVGDAPQRLIVRAVKMQADEAGGGSK